jgi:hypothetical protein
VPSSRRSGKRPYATGHVELDLDRATGGRTTQSAPDGEWVVQRVRASAKQYRCPGCDQIVAEVAHVVVWRTDALVGGGVEDRRHWHTACWDRRGRLR